MSAEYQKALKAVQSKKRKENFLLVKLEYNTYLLLPHKAGLLFLEALGEAEMLHTDYSKPHRIEGIEQNKFEITTLSPEDYDRHKIAALLNITFDEVKAFENPAAALIE